MTIVVLIILAVVSINVVLGENGIIRQAESSRAHQANGVASDNEKIEQWDAEIANALAGGSGTPADYPAAYLKDGAPDVYSDTML